MVRTASPTTAPVSRYGGRRHAIISTDRFPADLPFPGIALRLRCSACGSREVGVMRDMLAHDARMHAETGWGTGSAGPLPAHDKAVGRDVPWPDEEG
ncbi:hypothetical protein [Methylobacterium nodulans]|uniref:Uncharacterized protein n=1 Tax=Methylobacterium nodulans (strain LMG 21967 / CNCM I-2342 / ORS 2060) TaxID=460265 RepID=B8IKZ6_METNO|nr:hypothetical protein [Methylobacterium nodulans]ACL58184.1 hypothetical protein Mnod_3261 [Methylobacterium nodulans ORS 2060]